MTKIRQFLKANGLRQVDIDESTMIKFRTFAYVSEYQYEIAAAQAAISEK